ncbi:regulator of G-protein signaling 7-like isoform X2 [Varroa destructor]|uniref:Regulator of G-protein signaling 7 n=1 Tax=Varroa destructor TaxID=109461 RepID=A0A7M7KDG1_VARDE|nr:regulator of G-protein signaling 7-like isoform X2 [Varroa destructor]
MSSDSENELLKEPREYATEPLKALSPAPAGPLSANSQHYRPPGSPHLTSHHQNSHDDVCIESCFLKMERLIAEMQHPELGIPVRSQKLFLTSIPCAFVGYDVVEWIMDNLDIDDQSGPVAQEALHLANLLCQHGYFFPVGENAKTYTIKDDSTLYRFQAPEYWASRNNPDNTEYALYLLRRTLKNKPKNSLEDYEIEALQRLKKLLANKWDTLCQQAEEQIAPPFISDGRERIKGQSKEKKKTDKVISSSQERAYWRIHRPPPGTITCLERCPVPSRRIRKKKTTPEQLKRQIKILKSTITRSRAKSTLWQRSEDYREFDAFLCPPLPSNPWVSDDPTFWIIESHTTDTLTERRLRRWTLSLEELLSDPRGFQEFETYLRKEYSYENILFWKAVQDLKRGSYACIPQRVTEIHSEYLSSGAPCEVNLDSATMEVTLEAIKKPSRYTFDHAQQHVFTLMQTDIYPRFLRSEHFRSLMVKASLLQIQSQRKRFFNFASGRKKPQICSGADARPSTSQGHLANAGLLYTGQNSRVCAAITEQTQQAPARRLSGSTCDLRESIKRRNSSRQKRLASSGSKTDLISDDDSISVASQFSGRHSLSTSDLQTLTAPSTASTSEIFADSDKVLKHEAKATASAGAAGHSGCVLGQRAATASTSDADVDLCVTTMSPTAEDNGFQGEPPSRITEGLTPEEAMLPPPSVSPKETDTEDPPQHQQQQQRKSSLTKRTM